MPGNGIWPRSSMLREPLFCVCASATAPAPAELLLDNVGGLRRAGSLIFEPRSGKISTRHGIVGPERKRAQCIFASSSSIRASPCLGRAQLRVGLAARHPCGNACSREPPASEVGKAGGCRSILAAAILSNQLPAEQRKTPGSFLPGVLLALDGANLIRSCAGRAGAAGPCSGPSARTQLPVSR
jgi:hypothetical protein